MKRLIVALVVCVIATLGPATQVAAEDFEQFQMIRAETVHGCVSEEAVGALFRAVTTEGYWEAVAEVANVTRQACPRYGPFRDDIMQGVVVGREESSGFNGYKGMVLVRWSFEGSTRQHYSLLLENNFGVWASLVDVVLEARAASGILEFLNNNN